MALAGRRVAKRLIGPVVGGCGRAPPDEDRWSVAGRTAGVGSLRTVPAETVGVTADLAVRRMEATMTSWRAVMAGTMWMVAAVEPADRCWPAV